VSADAVLFDLDGVLVDSRAVFVSCVNAALEANGLKARPAADLHDAIGPPLLSTFRELTGDEALAASCVAAYRERYTERAVAETPVFGGIPEALAALGDAGLPLVVATSKARPLAETVLRGLGLRDAFHAVVGPPLQALDETKVETVDRALLELPGRASVVMVGDRRFDMVAARAHGLRGIGARWGIGSDEELATAGAEVLADAPADLPGLILDAP
jgi:phosphoglycolate phosphatase